MKVLRKIVDCKNLEISQENVYDGKMFNKFTNLQYTDYNSTVKRLLHRFFQNIFRKPPVLKRIISEKIPSRTRSASKIQIYLFFFSVELQIQSFFLQFSQKELHHGSFRIFGKFSARYLYQAFSNNVRMYEFTKIYRINF